MNSIKRFNGDILSSKAVIFDFDGVIIDSMEIQKTALRESHNIILGNEYPSPSFDDFIRHSGDSLQNIFLKMNLPLEMVDVYCSISRKNISKITVFDGIRELLDDLKVHGVLCGICTGKDRIRTLEILDYHQLLHYFQVIVCSDDVAKPKPHPESLLSAMESLHVFPENVIMIGDAPNDIQCAQRAGVRSIAVSWGEASRCDFADSVPDYSVTSVRELQSCILEQLLVK